MGGRQTGFLSFSEGEVIPRLFSEERAFGKPSTWDLVRNPEVAGGAAIEVDGVFDMKPFKGLSL